MTEDDMRIIIKSVDSNNNEKIEFQEFMQLMKNFKKSDIGKKITKLVDKKGDIHFKVDGSDNFSFSTFSEEEKSAFVKVINTVLAEDSHCQKYLPIDPSTNDLFAIMKDGVVLCKLINCASKGTIDERVINKKENMNVFLCHENLKLAISSAKSIGCQIINIFPETFTEQKYTLILGMLWQLIKIILLGEVNIKSHPQLVRLLQNNESLPDLLKMKPEDVLMRWFNYHLAKANHPDKVTNFSSDVKGGTKYTLLLNQLDSNKCSLAALDETDHKKRAEKILANSKKLGVESFITADDIVSGNSKLNILFTAAIFNKHHGLDDITQDEEYEAAKLLNDDIEGTREERAFRMWVNSLGMEDVYANNLYEDSKSGVLLLKVIDKIHPGSVNWKKVDLKANNKFKKLVNCNEAIDAAKKAGLKIVGIGGADIHDGNKKLILAVVWQLMRKHTLQVQGNKTEEELLAWANEMVTDIKITSFKDSNLKNAVFFIDLMSKIESRAIDWDLVNKGIHFYNC